MNQKEAITTVQSRFFDVIKQLLKRDESLPHILCELLNISQDSAYRRLRGETALSLDEASIIVKHFNISMSEVVNTSEKTISFQNNNTDPTNFKYIDFLNQLKRDLKGISLFKQNHLSYLAKDIPFFYMFFYPELAAFRVYFWKKSVFNFESHRSKRFSPDELTPEEIAAGDEIMRIYNAIPSTELWNDEVIISLINQIVFYYQAGFFEKPYYADKLLDKLHLLVTHFHKMAESGKKFLPEKSPEDGNAAFELYYNELMIGDNTVFADVDGHKRVYHSTNIINTMYTTHPEYCNQTYSVHTNLLKGSQQISVSGEKLRNQYFNRLFSQIEKARLLLE
jgi:hypothetical protein